MATHNAELIEVFREWFSNDEKKQELMNEC